MPNASAVKIPESLKMPSGLSLGNGLSCLPDSSQGKIINWQ